MKKKLGLMTLSLMLVSPALAGGAGKPVAKPAACRTIAALVSSDPQFSTLATAIDAAGLTGALNATGSVTVFAPTNAAFAKVPSDRLAALLNDKEALTALLGYHVVSEKATAAELRTASSGTTVLGEDVRITLSGNRIQVNNANVVKADILACNGVVHAIDAVLMPQVLTVTPAPAPAPVAQTPAPAPTPAPVVSTPIVIPALPLSGATTSQTTTTQVTTTVTTPAPATPAEPAPAPAEPAAETAATEVAGVTLYDAIVADDRFSTLRDLLSDADLTDMLMSGEYTIFAPTDEAFAALPEGALAAIAANPEVLLSLLKYHVVAGKLSADQIKAGNLTTAAGSSLTVSANLAPVIESTNGLIYPVDAVLLPTNFVVPTLPEEPTAETSTETTSTEVATAPADFGALLEDARFSTVRELLTTADLLNTLGSEEYTIFLPTNDAFAKLDAAKLADLRANPEKLKQALNYLILKGRQDAAALVAGPLTTVEGSTLTITRDDKGLNLEGSGMVLDGANAVQLDSTTVYVIDSVVLPPSLR